MTQDKTIARRAGTVPAPAGANAEEVRDQLQAALKAWLSGKSQHTVRAGLSDLRLFASFVRGGTVEDPVDAALVLLEGGQLAAESSIADWRTDMADRQLQATSIARRLASLRSFVATMKRFGLGWDLNDVRGPSYSPYARATGPDIEDLEAKVDELGALAQGDDTLWRTLIAARDHAMLLVLFHTAMRRTSIVSLKWKDTRLTGAHPHTSGVVKGGKTRRFPLSQQCVAALQRWRALRVAHLGKPKAKDHVFVSVTGPDRGSSLTADSVYKRFKYRHQLSGPHGIRHTTASTIYDRTGNLKLVQDILGHANAATSQSYMDHQGHSVEEAMRVISGEDSK